MELKKVEGRAPQKGGKGPRARGRALFLGGKHQAGSQRKVSRGE